MRTELRLIDLLVVRWQAASAARRGRAGRVIIEFCSIIAIDPEPSWSDDEIVHRDRSDNHSVWFGSILVPVCHVPFAPHQAGHG